MAPRRSLGCASLCAPDACCPSDVLGHRIQKSRPGVGDRSSGAKVDERTLEVDDRARHDDVEVLERGRRLDRTVAGER